MTLCSPCVPLQNKEIGDEGPTKTNFSLLQFDSMRDKGRFRWSCVAEWRGVWPGIHDDIGVRSCL